jgi:MraZ protein
VPEPIQDRRTSARQPQGGRPGRLDDKGRLKLPGVFHTYLSSFDENCFFVTSVNGRTAQIYPISLWMQNLEVLSKHRGSSEEVRNYLFNAQDLGAEAEIDGQGRLLFNPELRRELLMDSQGLTIQPVGGHLEVVTDAIAGEERKAARTGGVASQRKLESELGVL